MLSFKETGLGFGNDWYSPPFANPTIVGPGDLSLPPGALPPWGQGWPLSEPHVGGTWRSVLRAWATISRTGASPVPTIASVSFVGVNGDSCAPSFASISKAKALACRAAIA